MNIGFSAVRTGLLAAVLVALVLTVTACTTQEGALGLSPTGPGLVSASMTTNGATAVALASKSTATGCPAWGNPGGNAGLRFVDLLSPTEAVALSVAQITDAWYTQNGLVEETFIAARLEGTIAIDKNGDGLVCVAQGWGENLNPKSHWARI